MMGRSTSSGEGIPVVVVVVVKEVNREPEEEGSCFPSTVKSYSIEEKEDDQSHENSMGMNIPCFLPGRTVAQRVPQ